LVWLDPLFVDRIRDRFASHSFVDDAGVKKLGQGESPEKIREILEQGAALPLYFQEELVGAIRRDHDKDDTLKPEVLLENLMAKASGSLAMLHLFKRANLSPLDVDFVLDCTETAIGDRYNRGGGSLSKAMAEMTGCANATGNYVRAFCCAPVHSTMS